jgi:two-component system heavy metal sensor histidine kinase CusS
MESVSHIHPLALDRGLTLDFHPGVEARSTGDPELVDRVITNLLDNAIKYTPSGGAVQVELETVGEQHLVRVRDNGRGIPVDAQARVFDRFFRADGARTRLPSGGAGLGLSIAWRIARAHGGSLELTRSDENGTEFTLSLPAA